MLCTKCFKNAGSFAGGRNVEDVSVEPRTGLGSQGSLPFVHMGSVSGFNQQAPRRIRTKGVLT